jgi:hypothetical protein
MTPAKIAAAKKLDVFPIERMATRTKQVPCRAGASRAGAGP